MDIAHGTLLDHLVHDNSSKDNHKDNNKLSRTGLPTGRISPVRSMMEAGGLASVLSQWHHGGEHVGSSAGFEELAINEEPSVAVTGQELPR